VSKLRGKVSHPSSPAKHGSRSSQVSEWLISVFGRLLAHGPPKCKRFGARDHALLQGFTRVAWLAPANGKVPESHSSSINENETDPTDDAARDAAEKGHR
jgi:hypothetical protein